VDFCLFVCVLYLVFPMLPVSQDCSFFVAPTNFSVVYVYIYHRLCKQVYNEMINNNDTFWDYDTLNLGIIRCLPILTKQFWYRSKLLLVCTSSIILFLVFISNIEFREAWLWLSKQETSGVTSQTIPLKKYLYRMNMSQTDVCDLCNAEVGEKLEHVIFDCPVYDEIRLKFSSLFNPEPYEGTSSII
jgi:hypothetical protein